MPLVHQTVRAKKKSKVCEEMADAYKEYAGKIKAVEARGVDPQVVRLAKGELEIACRRRRALP